MFKRRIPTLVSTVVSLFLLAILASTAAAAPCTPGSGYDPMCDVNQDDTIDVNDILLTAGHWSNSGTWTLAHDHFGETWTGTGTGLDIRTSSGGTYAFVAVNEATTGTRFGIWGESNSVDGAGVMAQGVNAGADLMLGGNADTVLGDDGRIVSDVRYASSDIYLISNDGVRIELDDDNGGEDADFEIADKDDNKIFNIDEDGTISSAATSYIWISGNDVRPYHQSDSTIIDMDTMGGAYVKSGGSGAQTRNVMLPITVPGPLYGQNVRITDLDIFWKADSGFDAITAVLFRRQTGVGNYVNIVFDNTTVYGCEDVVFPNGCTIHYDTANNNVLTADSGILYLTLGLFFQESADWIEIGGVRLTLEHD